MTRNEKPRDPLLLSNRRRQMMSSCRLELHRYIITSQEDTDDRTQTIQAEAPLFVRQALGCQPRGSSIMMTCLAIALRGLLITTTTMGIITYLLLANSHI